MRFPVLLRVLGVLALMLSPWMGLTALLALGYGGGDAAPIALAAGVSAALGALGIYLGRAGRRAEINHREGFAIVSLGWILAAALGALPYTFWAHGLGPGAGTPDRCGPVAQAPEASTEGEPPLGREFCDYTNSYFETMSGLTTTGATIITRGLWPAPNAPVGLPHGLLFWRALTHWLGGMGIILLSLAILPLLGVGGMQLYRAEVPGPTSDKLVPRVSETAKVLWAVYGILTVAEIALLTLGGVDLYVAATHTFGTLATGGFSVLATSVEGFHSPYVEWVTTAFMMAAGASFTLHYWALRGKVGVYLKDPEFKLFAAIFLVASLLIGGGLLLRGVETGLEPALRSAAFQVASIVTTTGYASVDFELWVPVLPMAPFILFLLMFIGGCAGSTGGGMKVVRVALSLGMGRRELVHLVHPRAVLNVRFGDRSVSKDILKSVTGFVLLYLLVFGLGALALTGFGVDFVSAVTASAASVGNIGPGLGGVGPYDNYCWLPTGAKWVCIVQMLMGRLEIYTVLVLLLPQFWARR